jgi:hypothetical protein
MVEVYSAAPNLVSIQTNPKRFKVHFNWNLALFVTVGTIHTMW